MKNKSENKIIIFEVILRMSAFIDIIIAFYLIIYLLMTIYQANLVYIMIRYLIHKITKGERKLEKITEEELLPSITIQIPTFNESPSFVVNKILQSIVDQNYPLNLLKVIIANQSDDEKHHKLLLELIKEFESKNKLEIDYHRINRFGDGKNSYTMFKAGSLNKISGENTKTDLIVVLDSDTTLHKDFLLNMVQPFIQDPTIGISLPRHVVKQSNLIARYFRLSYNSNNLLMKMRSQINFPQFIEGNGIMIRKELIKKNSWDTICEDALMGINIYLDGWKIWFVEEAIIYNQGIPTSITDMKNRWVRIIYGQYQGLKRKSNDSRIYKNLQIQILYSSLWTLPIIMLLFPLSLLLFFLNIDVFGYFMVLALFSGILIIWSIFFTFYASYRYRNLTDIIFSPILLLLMGIHYIVPGAIAVFKSIFRIPEEFYPTQRKNELSFKKTIIKPPSSVRVVESVYLLISIIALVLFKDNSNAVFFFTTYFIIMLISFIDGLPFIGSQ